MKIKLLFFTFFLSYWIVSAQVAAGQIDDFEDNTTQSWTVGNANVAANLISLPADGGPDGNGDQFFRFTTTGALNGAGSRCVVFSINQQWSGDFIAQGIVAIKMNVRAINRDLTLRIGFSDETTASFLPTTQLVTDPIIITEGSGWQEVTIPIQPSDLNILPFGDGATAAEVMANVAEMRILSQPLEDWVGEAGIIGDPTPRSMDLDNITAATTLNVQNFETLNGFEISPNPASSQINIKLADSLNNANMVVYDVLGKKVFDKRLNTIISRVDVSDWNTGVYLVKLTANNKTFTKRFVKQ